MFDTICSLPLSSDLLTQDIHPSIPLVTIGLASGHVQTFKLPPTAESSSSPEASLSLPDTDFPSSALSSGPLKRRRRSSIASENGLGEIETAWRTRRHKGSCRCVKFGPDGRLLYSAGTDGLVKIANAEDGRVEMKLAIPRIGSQTDAPSLLHPSTPQTLLLATDSSALYLYDLRTRNSSDPSTSSRPSQTYHPHGDFISSINPLPGASSSSQARQFLTTGSTTLAVTDIRKGILSQSEEQQDELTASLFIEDSPAGGIQGTAVVADVGGSLSLWKHGTWQDHSERLPVDRDGEPLESIALAPDVMSGPLLGKGKVVAVGLADGLVRFVSLRTKKVVVEADVKHDDLEGVVGLGFDQVGRMVSGGGRVLKIWREADVGVWGQGSAGESADESDQDSSEEEEVKKQRKKKKRNKKNKAGGNRDLEFNLE